MGETLFHIVDSTLLLAILGGLAHMFSWKGSLDTKVDTMWKWFNNGREQ